MAEEDVETTERIGHLVRKRGTYKGHQSKSVTKLALTDGDPAEALDYNCLEGMTESAQRTLDAMEDIQLELIRLCPARETEFAADYQKCLDQATTLLDELSLRAQRGRACRELETILQFLTAFRCTTSSPSILLTQQLQTRDNRFDEIQGKYRRAIRADPKLTSLVTAIVDKLSRIYNELPAPTAMALPTPVPALSEHGLTARSSHRESTRHRRLPILVTPTFRGNPLEWTEFWSSFQRNVHNNPDLEEEEKLSYLQQSIKDKEQTNLVDSLAGTYQECVDSLQRKYDQPRLVHKHYVKELYNCAPGKDDTTQELTRLHTTVSQAIKKMEATTLSSAEADREAYIESLLPYATWRRWMELNPEQKKVPNLKDLLTFIELQAKLNLRGPSTPTPDRPVYKRDRDKAPSKPKSANPQSAKPERALHALKHTVHPCIMCRDGGHSLYGCPKFAASTVEERIAFVESNNLCYNCMGLGHGKRSCRSVCKCKSCGRRHHSLLHKDQLASSTTSTSGVTPAGSVSAVSHQHTVSATSTEDQATIPPTMKLTVSSPWGRSTDVTALFDGGATVSVVTRRIVAKLGLTTKRCHLRLVQALGKATSANTSTVQLSVKSSHLAGETRQFTAVVVPIIGQAGTGQRVDSSWDTLSKLPLANPEFRTDSTIDLIIGQNISADVYLDRRQRNDDNTLSVQETIWGWTVEGRVGRPQRLPNQETTATRTLDQASLASITLNKAHSDAEGNSLLKRFFEEEAMEEESALSLEDHEVMEHFQSTHKVLPDGRMEVTLPRRSDCGALGTSRGQALQRFLTNEKSLTRRKALQPFQLVMAEYFDLNQAEVISLDELKHTTDSYYMPMHAVVKATSTSTKLRIVFDASATTSSGLSLNDTLHIGPTVYPPLTSILMRFRSHRIGITADISKMYREISLNPSDRDLHRFLWRKSPSEPILDCRMRRVTFGVASSPFLATQAIQQIATIHHLEHPEVAKALRQEFYVDDFVSGSETEDQAVTLQEQVRYVLDLHQLSLCKWRSSSANVMERIPQHLHEKETIMQPEEEPNHLKTLGIKWNSTDDVFHISISQLALPPIISKRALTSDIARTFDVLGWMAPATFSMKSLIQRLWASGLDWDDPVPPDVQQEWTTWRDELPSLARQPIPRNYFNYCQGTRCSTSLHGFSDASMKGYAAVIYLRTTYSSGFISVVLVRAKTKVAPLKGLTVPRLELCGAQLLAQLIAQTRSVLDIPVNDIHCWTDSAIVLYWLDGKTRPHKAYVANRVHRTLSDVPPRHWKHVPGVDNPADCASRGITPGALQAHGLWWHGPAWLSQDPIVTPPQPHLSHLDSSFEELVKGRGISAITVIEEPFEAQYSTYTRLMHVIAWIFRFKRNTHLQQADRPEQRQLSIIDIQTAEVVLYRRAQHRMTGRNISHWIKDKTIQSLNPTADHHGIFRVNGRLHNSALAYAQRHPIILEGKDVLTKLILRHLHFRNSHAGPTLLMAAVGRNHHLIRGLVTVKAICHGCVVCRRFNLKTETQLMGQLPRDRVNPSRPFSHVGTDFAGPMTIKRGHTRRPALIKAYVCAFVCLATKAVHLEMVSELTTEAFMSCLTRFVGRRGLPESIHSDNGTNYVGASRELTAIYALLREEETQKTITTYCTNSQIKWHFSPARAPHFGGIWEAAIKSFKTHFRRITSKRTFTFEEMSTILISIEAAMNSRPLMPLHCHPEDGVETLTPGHFIIGQPINALPEENLLQSKNLKSHFLQGQQLCQQFWLRWSTEYLQQLNRRTKWQKPHENVKVGDIALIRGELNFKTNDWPMARVVKVHQGQDGLVRAVDLQNGQRTFRRPIAKLTILVQACNEESGTGTPGMPLPPAGMSESVDLPNP